MTSSKTTYLEKSIRDGFTSEDVRLWQSLCRQCETDIGFSQHYMHYILDLAKHNQCGALDIIKTGRMCSEQKAVNQKFIESLMLAVASDGEDSDVDDKAVKSVLDLTADEEMSGSYEETSENYHDNPTSADAYEIDGFVVPDSEETVKGKKNAILTPEQAVRRASVTDVKVSGLARRNALVETPAGAVALKPSWKKRVLESITEEEE